MPQAMKTNSTKKTKKLPRFLDKNDPLEKVIEKTVCDYGKTLGIEHRKYANPSRRAAPDQIFFTPQSNRQPLTWFIEFKSKGKTPTEAQEIEHEFYRSLGFYVFVIDNVNDGKDLMRIMC